MQVTGHNYPNYQSSPIEYWLSYHAKESTRITTHKFAHSAIIYLLTY